MSFPLVPTTTVCLYRLLGLACSLVSKAIPTRHTASNISYNQEITAGQTLDVRPELQEGPRDCDQEGEGGGGKESTDHKSGDEVTLVVAPQWFLWSLAAHSW